MIEGAVGVRDLKARLSQHLRRVKAGGTIVVTEHGRPIARLVPIEADVSERIHGLVQAGTLAWSGRPLPPAPFAPQVRPGASVSDLLIEDRG
jgi:prevent-host-death family protein